MQRHRPRQKRTASVLARDPLVAVLPDLREHDLDVDIGGVLTQPGARERQVAIARVAEEGLIFRSERRHKTRLRDIEQRAQDPAAFNLANRRHRCQAIGAAARLTPQPIGFDLVLAMVAGQQMETALHAAPLAQKAIARRARRLLDAARRFFAVPDEDFVTDRTGRQPLRHLADLGAAFEP